MYVIANSRETLIYFIFLRCSRVDGEECGEGNTEVSTRLGIPEPLWKGSVQFQ